MKILSKRFLRSLKLRVRKFNSHLKRWINGAAPRLIDLTALSLSTYLLIYLLLRTGILDAPLLFLSEAFNALHPLIAHAFLFLIGFSLPLFLKKHNSYNINHTLINDWKNPPIYIAPFAITIVSICFHSELMEMLQTEAILAFTLGLFLCLCLMEFKNKKEKSNNDNINFDMKIWLEKEIPIRNKDYDFLGFHAYVDRIITLLTKRDEKKSNQVVIRGDFGSGKSSLCRLLEEKLASQHDKKFIFCYADGWGREDSSFAGQILEIAVETLSEHTDCSSLIGVPENYTNALNGSGLNSIIAAAQLFSSPQKSDPEQHLRKIDGILIAIDSHMVIVLEDFDRGPKPSKAIGELGSLLERTKNLKNIHFVLCMKRDRSTIIDKICTHVEDLHQISSESSEKLIKKFLVFIEKEYPPATLKIESTNYHFMPETNPLIKTPRALKLALRRTFTAWQNLKGEIDLIDLLHFNILRLCQPESFLFFLDNFKTLNFMKGETAQNREELKRSLDTKLERLNLADYEMVGVKLLINSIFSDPYLVLNITPSAQAQLNRFERAASTRNMQRLVNAGNTNYLNRAISEFIPKSELKDQEIINAIKSTNSEAYITKKLQAIEEPKNYGIYLEGVINWIIEINESTEIHLPLLEKILKSEISRLFLEKSCPFLLNYFSESDSIFSEKSYILIEKIIYIFCSNKINNNGYHYLVTEIYSCLILKYTSVAIQLINGERNTSIQYRSRTYEIFQECINKTTYNHILKSIDPKHTKSLSSLFFCTPYPTKKII
jgi:hypothetical protein